MQDWKRVRVNGWKFTIRRINPILDFPADRMPQIFAEAVSRRAPAEKPVKAAEDRALEDFKSFISRGVVHPLVGLKDDGKCDFTVDDLLRDGDTAQKLYAEIMFHSLAAFRGLRGFFLSVKTRLSLAIAFQKNTASAPPISPSDQAAA